jgi:hypothetical protein
MKTYSEYLKEAYEEQVSRVVKNPNEKKSYKNAKYTPLSVSEQKKALETLAKLPRAGSDRNWFNTDNEIDTRDLGFIHSMKAPVRVTMGGGKSHGPALVPYDKIIALQSSVKVEGLEAYIANKKLVMPVVLEYKDKAYYSVLAGHTRIAAQMLAGRKQIECLVVLEDWLFKGGGRVKMTNYLD